VPARPHKEPPVPFSDDAEYLQAQVERVHVLLERALAVAAGDAAVVVRRATQAGELRRAIGERVQATQAAGRAIGFEQLRRRFNLDEEDTDLLLHAVATHLDGTIARLHTKLAGVPFHPWLDVELAIQVHHDSVGERLRARGRFQPEAPLFAHRLLTLDRNRPDAKDNLLNCELKVPPRVARIILGSDPTGGGVSYAQLEEPEVELDQVMLPPETRQELVQLLAAQPSLRERLSDWGYDELLERGRAVTILIQGAPGTGKSMLARALARRLDKPLLVIEGHRLTEAGRNLEQELDELLLEARLRDAVVLFEAAEALFGRGNARLSGVLFRALDRFDGLCLLATNQPERLDPTLDRRVLLRLVLELPGPALRERIWRQLLGPRVPLGPDVNLAPLAKRYELSGGAIKSAVLYAVSKSVARGDGSPLAQADLEQAAQAQLRGDLSNFAEKTRGSRLTLEVLILPEEEKSQIREIIAAGRQRAKVLFQWGFSEKLPTGKGLIALFSGEPGTGKTLAAEVVAAELGLPLYRVNPAKVVSKYVGETEKNLNEILSQAKSSNSILFFDEADALFSTRVAKVESANDRFVNLETNFLLQQLERYEGIVILATNLETTIDQAFKRRIAYHVQIPFPKPEDRTVIWRTLIPSKAPSAPIDFAKLARNFELSGGHIKNAILRAAYVAAERGEPIDYDMLAHAAELESVAAGKLFRRQD
jgi:SpoVK/Ycf46/Vps4 family AAA+-type ATPase